MLTSCLFTLNFIICHKKSSVLLIQLSAMTSSNFFTWMRRMFQTAKTKSTVGIHTEKLKGERDCENEQMKCIEEMKDEYTDAGDYRCSNFFEGTRRGEDIQPWPNQTINTWNKLFQGKDESYGMDISHMNHMLIELPSLEDLDLNNKFTLLPPPKSMYCDLNKCDEEVEEVFKNKKTVERVSSLVIGAIEFLWMMSDICSNLLPQHGPFFICFSLLEMAGFMVFVCAILARIIVGAPFSHMQRGMLMFWASWMQVRSVKSLTELYLPMLGQILLMGCYVIAEKKAPPKG
ncbi:hypothetical protein Fmac_017231 [Flemingia macrophylla]|uniref:Uncharacterized protein n=1 Tax=Flemingia macrophylla TaxID=520843 RepID=A0ABD1M1K1_9FABA